MAERIRQRVAQIRLPRRVGREGRACTTAWPAIPSDGRTLDFLIKICDQRLYDCRRVRKLGPAHGRRHPRFAVQGLTLRLARGAWRRQRELEVQDIGYGGLAFLNNSRRASRAAWRAS